jgi:hypothetical protein
MRGSDVNWEGAAYLGVTEQPDLRGPRYDQRENTGRAERRLHVLMLDAVQLRFVIG